MLVSHRHKFIYTKTRKTAGTSVESFFERFCMDEGEWEQVHARDEYDRSSGIIGFRGGKMPAGTKWYNHMPASLIKEQLGNDRWDSYFKFCVVRNPYDKCISAFEHFGKDHRVSKFDLAHRIQSAGMTPEQSRFLSYLKKAAPNDRDKYVIDGEYCLDDVIKFESLEADIQRICNQCSLSFDAQYLPTFKKGHRREESTIESLYTPAAKRQVEANFSFEIEQFKYSFPSSPIGNS